MKTILLAIVFLFPVLSQAKVVIRCDRGDESDKGDALFSSSSNYVVFLHSQTEEPLSKETKKELYRLSIHEQTKVDNYHINMGIPVLVTYKDGEYVIEPALPDDGSNDYVLGGNISIGFRTMGLSFKFAGDDFPKKYVFQKCKGPIPGVFD